MVYVCLIRTIVVIIRQITSTTGKLSYKKVENTMRNQTSDLISIEALQLTLTAFSYWYYLLDKVVCSLHNEAIIYPRLIALLPLQEALKVFQSRDTLYKAVAPVAKAHRHTDAAATIVGPSSVDCLSVSE